MTGAGRHSTAALLERASERERETGPAEAACSKRGAQAELSLCFNRIQQLLVSYLSSDYFFSFNSKTRDRYFQIIFFFFCKKRKFKSAQ